jgi:hypothetical protein
LDLLDMSRISKIILEVREVSMVEHSQEILMDYLQTRTNPARIRSGSLSQRNAEGLISAV